MIKSYKQITTKYIRTNKKRTILTIIGIVLSVALISTIGLFFKDIQYSDIEDAKKKNGSFHLEFTNLDSDTILKITNNPKVSRYGFIVLGESIKINEKLTTNLIMASDKAMEIVPANIKKGKLPKDKTEVAVENWVLRYIDINAKIGDKIKINNKQYTLSGILEDGISNQINNSGLILTKDNDINKEKALLLVEISPKTNLKRAIRELESYSKKGSYSENLSLIVLQGGRDDNRYAQSINMILFIIIGIVLIATIAVIYNAFQISITQRMKQFGLLRAVGTTPKQIRSIVFREATILALIGIPIGLLCSIIAIYGVSIAFRIISGYMGNFLKFKIFPDVLGLSAFVGLLSIYISALIPAFSAGRISPLTAINSRTTIKKENIKRSKNKLIRFLFGFEGDLALKNIKRNKKRYRTTVFSIVISVLLFITFKSFVDMTSKVTSKPNKSNDIQFTVMRDYNTDGEEIDENLINKLKSLSSIKSLYKAYSVSYFQAAFDRDREVKAVKNINDIYKEIKYEGKDKTLVDAGVAIYDNNSFEIAKKYIQSGKIDLDIMNKENGVVIINNNVIYNSDVKKSYYGGVTDLKVGDEIYIQNDEEVEGKSVNFGSGKVKKVKIMAILNEEPFNFNGDSKSLKIVTTENVAKYLLDKSTLTINRINITINDIKNAESTGLQIENTIKINPSLKVVNNIDENKNRTSPKLMAEILLYGFVIVVSLISSVNIINTLTTNIILRKREFGILKSIGLTQKGLKKMIALEGFSYGVIGTFIGSLLGCGASYALYKGISNARDFSWKIPYSAIIIACVCALTISYLSVLSPLSTIKKENLIDSVREE